MRGHFVLAVLTNPRLIQMQREQKKTTDRRTSGAQVPQNKRSRPCMPPERIKLLESIGFSWESVRLVEHFWRVSLVALA